ncbi:MAG TPA: hypothetical protein VGK36_04940 [Candidatus Angelobacter sp.]|jgi:hypothetical protein
MMVLRFLAGSLLLGAFVLARALLQVPASPTPENYTNHPKWEYKALKLDATQCSVEGLVSHSLNAAGDEGWELVSYERLSNLFPKDAEGTLLIRPAATGKGLEHTPQTADSFQGTMSMRMAAMQPGACRFLFKRPALAVAKR